MINEFEQDILKSILYYQSKGFLVADKVTERVTFGRQVSYGKSKFDFWTLYEGKFFAIEAKSRKAARMPITNNIPDHQVANLIAVKEHGGFGLLAFRLLRDGMYYSFLGDISLIVGLKGIGLDELLDNDEWHEIDYTDEEVYDLPAALDFFIERTQ